MLTSHWRLSMAGTHLFIAAKIQLGIMTNLLSIILLLQIIGGVLLRNILQMVSLLLAYVQIVILSQKLLLEL